MWSAGYDPKGFFCEHASLSGDASPAQSVFNALKNMGEDELRRRDRAADQELLNLGITFTVYTERDAIDRVLPFDVIPRIIAAKDWFDVEAGSLQRIQAINLFLDDIYGPQKILKDGVVPRELVLGHPAYRPEISGVAAADGARVNIAGVDLVRIDGGEWRVLEDNCRVPSGVSYVVENRALMLRVLPELAEGLPLRPVDDYGERLRRSLSEIAPAGVEEPRIAVLTPGVFNSAYFEHVFLAREMGANLVEGRDLVVQDDRVFMKTVGGLKQIDVIYRRVDDDFLDPEVFRKDSVLGVAGLMRAWRTGHVALANAVGTGVADDKAVYAFIPEIIKYYLDQDPILKNVETYSCAKPDDRAYVLDHLDELVVKPVDGSGGYGVVIGPHATTADLEETRAGILERPEKYIAQPFLKLSVCPTLTKSGVAPRHVDLRPFVVTGRSSWTLPGGLTRVALREGSAVVNSSQGGGSKDTWVIG